MRAAISMLFLMVLCATGGIAAPVAPAPKPPIKYSPLPKGIRAERNLQYVADGDPSHTLDLYLPETPGGKAMPLVVWLHGGAWHTGDKAGCHFTYLVPDGYIVASVEYRFSQKAIFPAQIQDCQAAIRWLRANAKKYNIDTNHIGVGGNSAGGHLVALLGTAGGKKAFPPIGENFDQSDRVQAVADYYGPTDFTTVMAQAAADRVTRSAIKFRTPDDPYSCLIGVNLGDDKAKADAVSPAHFVSKDNPPMILLHGDHDNLVPFAQSEELTGLLEREGVEVTLQRFPGYGHGGPAFDSPAIQKLVKKFFDKHLKGIDGKIEALPDNEVIPKPKPGK